MRYPDLRELARAAALEREREKACPLPLPVPQFERPAELPVARPPSQKRLRSPLSLTLATRISLVLMARGELGTGQIARLIGAVSIPAVRTALWCMKKRGQVVVTVGTGGRNLYKLSTKV